MITVIMPVYNEGEAIYENVHTVSRVLRSSAIEHGFLLVDDGSKDNSWQQMERVADTLPHVTLLRLSRNFGKEAALCAALEHATGDAVVVMDADLQHPPALIPEMVRLWRDEGYDVVDGVKASRGEESRLKKWLVSLYYRLFARATGLAAEQLSDFKLLDKAAVLAWRALPEHNTYFRGMSAWVGYRHCSLPFEVAPRTSGKTKWSFSALLRLSVNSVIAYTAAPLLLVLVLGILMGVAALVLTVQTLYMYFAHLAATGFSTVILLQLFIGSGLMIGLSIIGLYVGKIYEEVKGRPRYLLRDKRTPDDRN